MSTQHRHQQRTPTPPTEKDNTLFRQNCQPNVVIGFPSGFICDISTIFLSKYSWQWAIASIFYFFLHQNCYYILERRDQIWCKAITLHLCQQWFSLHLGILSQKEASQMFSCRSFYPSIKAYAAKFHIKYNWMYVVAANTATASGCERNIPTRCKPVGLGW